MNKLIDRIDRYAKSDDFSVALRTPYAKVMLVLLIAIIALFCVNQVLGITSAAIELADHAVRRLS